MSDVVDNPGRRGLRVASAIDSASAHAAASHSELERSASEPMADTGGDGVTTLKVRSPVLAKKIAEQQQQQPHKQRGTVFATVIQEVREDLDAFAHTLRAAFGLTPSPKQASAKDDATGEEVSSSPPSAVTDPSEARAVPAGDEVSITIPEQPPSTGKGEGVPQPPRVPANLDVQLEIHDSPNESPAFTPSDEKVVDRLHKRFEALETSASRLEGEASIDAKKRAQKVLVKLNSLKLMDERSQAILEEGPADLSQ